MKMADQIAGLKFAGPGKWWTSGCNANNDTMAHFSYDVTNIALWLA